MAQAKWGHTRCSCGTDRLTGLPDRWGWDDTAMAVFRHARRHGEDLSLLLVDLDRFKRINDELGHPAGDEVLAAVAEVLRAETRRIDLLGRYGGHGGDEFLVLLPDTGYAEANRVADRIKSGIAALSMTTKASSGALVGVPMLTASVGVASCGQVDDVVLDDLILLADDALRLAKNSRARTDDAALQRLLLDLRRTVDDDLILEVLAALSAGERYRLSTAARDLLVALAPAVHWSERYREFIR